MTAFRGHHAAQASHLDALYAKHSALEQKIRDALKHPSTSTVLISAMKAQKLRIKDEIERGKTG